jgi:hypothetical protein
VKYVVVTVMLDSQLTVKIEDVMIFSFDRKIIVALEKKKMTDGRHEVERHVRRR